MKKNKTIAYMLAATLLVGGTFVGTKALFRDKVDVVAELAISTGDVDIEAEDMGWEVVRNGEENTHYSNVENDNGNNSVGNSGDLSHEEAIASDFESYGTKFVNNLKPGDIIKKTVTIKNVGTLVATNINVINQSKDTALVDYKEAIIKKVVNGEEEVLTDTSLLLPGEEAIVYLELEINNVGGVHENRDGKTGFNTTSQEDTVINLTNAWQLTATQQNTRADLAE